MSLHPLGSLFHEAPEQSVAAGAVLFHRGDPVRDALWLVSGRVRLTRISETGAEAALHRAEGPCWLAEGSLFAESYHCDGVAETEASILRRPAEQVRAALSADPTLALAAVAHMSRELRDARARIEILGLKGVAARLDAWLANFGSKPDDRPWSAVAHEIAVTPEALYRELASRRRIS